MCFSKILNPRWLPVAILDFCLWGLFARDLLQSPPGLLNSGPIQTHTHFQNSGLFWYTGMLASDTELWFLPFNRISLYFNRTYLCNNSCYIILLYVKICVILLSLNLFMALLLRKPKLSPLDTNMWKLVHPGGHISKRSRVTRCHPTVLWTPDWYL